MKRMKTFFCLLFCLMATFLLPLSACGGGGGDVKIALVNFEDKTETVGLGENYTLPNGVAFDEDGNDYRVIYEVKDSAGEKVGVLNNRFKVKEMGEAKYVITCFAEVGDEKYQTRTITLNVIDRTAPDISIKTLAFAFVGERYEIKGVQVSDNTGEDVTPTYTVKKADGTQVTVENGAFTPDSKGEYTLTVGATDAAGNANEKTASIYVREPMGDYVLENFNDEYGTPVFSVKEAMLTEEDVAYHETFDPTPNDTENGDERTGVVEGTSVLSTSASYGAHYYFKFDGSFAEIGDFEYIYVKAYIQSSIAEYKPQVTLYSKNEPLGAGGGVQYNVNEWVEIRLTAEDICAPDSTFADPNELRDGETPIDCFFRKMTTGSGYYLFYIPNHNYTVGEETVKDNANNYVLFVDEIGYQPLFNPTVEVEDSYELGETVTLEPTVVTDEAEGDYEIAITVTDPSGNTVALENNAFRLTEAGEYTVELNYQSDRFGGYAKYTLTAVSTKEIEVGEFTGTPTQGDTVTVPAATIDGGDVSIAVTVNGYPVEMASATSFVANVAGEYVVTYSADIDGLIYKTTLAINVQRAAFTADEVNSFSSKSETDENVTASGFETAWLPAFAGEHGVVKLTSNGNGSDWSYFAFKQLQEMNSYAGFEYFVVRMYIPSSVEYVSSGVSFGNDAAILSVSALRDQWVDYVMTYQQFANGWGISDFNAYRKNIAIDVIGDIYVAGAFMMNGIEDTEITVSAKTAAGSEVIRDGDTFAVTLSDNAPSAAKITVTAPDGSVVADPANVTATFGKYTVKVTCDGYIGEITAEFEALSTFDFVFTSDGGVDGTEVTLKTYKVTVGETDVTADAEVTVTVTTAGYDQAIAVADGKFTAPVTGATYTVKFSVTYNGKTYAFSYETEVQSAYVATGSEVISFAEASQLAYTDTYDSTLTWLQSYEGKTGVVKMDAKNWGYFGFKPLQDMSAYQGCSYLVIRMYIATPDYSGKLWFGDKDNCMTAVKSGEWVDYYFPGSVFTTNWANCATDYNIWYMAMSVSKAAEVYIDEVFVETVEAETEVLTFAEETQVTNNTQGAESAVVTWQESYQGKTGVAKVTAPNAWGYFGFKPTHAMAAYDGANYLVIRMYIETENYGGTLWLGGANNCLTTVKAGEWVDYYFPGETFTTKWANSATAYDIWSMAMSFSQPVTAYIDEIFVASELPSQNA